MLTMQRWQVGAIYTMDKVTNGNSTCPPPLDLDIYNILNV